VTIVVLVAIVFPGTPASASSNETGDPSTIGRTVDLSYRCLALFQWGPGSMYLPYYNDFINQCALSDAPATLESTAAGGSQQCMQDCAAFLSMNVATFQTMTAAYTDRVCRESAFVYGTPSCGQLIATAVAFGYSLAGMVTDPALQQSILTTVSQLVGTLTTLVNQTVLPAAYSAVNQAGQIVNPVLGQVTTIANDPMAVAQPVLALVGSTVATIQQIVSSLQPTIDQAVAAALQTLSTTIATAQSTVAYVTSQVPTDPGTVVNSAIASALAQLNAALATVQAQVRYALAVLPTLSSIGNSMEELPAPPLLAPDNPDDYPAVPLNLPGMSDSPEAALLDQVQLAAPDTPVPDPWSSGVIADRGCQIQVGDPSITSTPSPGCVGGPAPPAPKPYASKQRLINYARAWGARPWNTEYVQHGVNAAGNDCTNFVSQALKYAGWKEDPGPWMSDGAWWYADAEHNYPQHSYTWGGAENLAHYLSGSGRAKSINSWASVKPGDLIQVEYRGAGRIGHTMVVTGGTSYAQGDLLLSYHSSNGDGYTDKSLRAFMDASPEAIKYVGWRLK
jgi:hypothetical protein